LYFGHLSCFTISTFQVLNMFSSFRHKMAKKYGPSTTHEDDYFARNCIAIGWKKMEKFEMFPFCVIFVPQGFFVF